MNTRGFTPSVYSGRNDGQPYVTGYDYAISGSNFDPTAGGANYSDAVESTTTTTTGEETGYEAYVPLAREFFFGNDPREEMAVVQARIRDYRAKARKSVWPIKGFYESEIAKLQARLTALKQQSAEQIEVVGTMQTGRVVFIIAGVAATLALAAVVVNQLSSARRYAKQAV